MINIIKKKIKILLRYSFEFSHYCFFIKKINFPWKNYNFIIATKSGIFLANNKSNIKILNGQYYGITRNKDRWIIFQSLPLLKKGRLVSIDDDGNIQMLLKKMSHGCHQIDCKDNYLYITDTYNNSVIKVDLFDMNIVGRYYPIGPNYGDRSLSNYGHINSIFFYGDYIYILCHNETMKTSKSSEVLKCDGNFNVLQRIEFQAGNAHNVSIYKGNLVICDSKGKRLVMEDGSTLFDFEHFTRGLSMTDKYIVVGESEYAKREERHTKGGWINIFDLKWNLLSRQRINGMVQEVRSIHESDHCMSGE
jgi:hypothetical protein